MINRKHILEGFIFYCHVTLPECKRYLSDYTNMQFPNGFFGRSISLLAWVKKKRLRISLTVPKFNSSPLEIGRAPKGKDRLPATIFQGLCSTSGGVLFLNVCVSKHQWSWNNDPEHQKHTTPTSRARTTEKMYRKAQIKKQLLWKHDAGYHCITGYWLPTWMLLATGYKCYHDMFPL